MAWLDNLILCLPYLVASLASLFAALVYVKSTLKDQENPLRSDKAFSVFIFCSLTHTSWVLLSEVLSFGLDEKGEALWDDHPYIALLVFFMLLLLFIVTSLVIGIRLPEGHANQNANDVSSEKQLARALYGTALALVFFQIIATVILQSVSLKYLSKYETCTNEWIQTDNNTGLHYAFRGRLFGQHLAEEQVKSALFGFHKDEKPSKPLVLSFHGRTGTGKNHVSRLIAESVYKNGLDSQFVHLKITSKDYPNPKDEDSYKEGLQKEIQTSVLQCPRQLFIFDEVEILSEGILEVIKSYIDYNENVGGVDFRKSIFIFLSKVGEREITEITLKHKAERDSIRISNVEKMIEKATSKQNETGLSRSHLMDSHLVSYFVPFLPLERRHVELCIKEEVLKMGLPPFSMDTVNSVIGELQFWPEDTKKYAVKGCKNVREKVSLIAHASRFPTPDEL